MKNKIAIISSDVIDSKMAGVGIRYWEIANSLSLKFEVVLICPNGSKLTSEKFRIIEFEYKNQNIKEFIDDASVIVISGFTLHFHPYLKDIDVPLAVDLYVPFMLESLIWHKNDDLRKWIPDFEEFLRVQNELLRAGDYFFCANERQRDFWIGMLLANKRINPHQILLDESLDRLIDIVPYGFRQPNTVQTPLKNVYAKYGISDNAKIIIWSGGVWDWLDPITLIHSFEKLQEKKDDVVLFFMGAEHPNNLDIKMSLTGKCKDLSNEMGLLNKKIFFGDWIPYNERWNYLRSADLCVLTFRNHIETRFSNRTRLVDCLGAELPIVITSGDYLGEELAKVGLAEVVPPEDINALADALAKMLNVTRILLSEKFQNFANRFQWDLSVQPLIEFCQNPKIATDKGKYLTDLERISNDKDEFLKKVIADKDEFLQNVIIDKDKYLLQVVKDKDEFLKKVVEEKDGQLSLVTMELKNEIENQRVIIEKYQKNILYRIYRKFKKILRRDRHE